uniref:flagellar biosynthetic protein FliO n=1 Tax=Ramlibacter sp. TaxID=1917967 RepID=UPI001819E316
VWLVLLAGAGAWAWIWSVRRRGAAPKWLGRWVPPGAPGVLQLLASKPLAPQCSVHVVRWAGRELLVGCTPQAVTLLDTREAAAPETAP